MKTSVSVRLREPVRAWRVLHIMYHKYREAPLKGVSFSILKNMKTQGYLPNKVCLKKMVETTAT